MPMMNVLEAIQNRRSIRRFTDTPVPRDMIETVLEAAIAAPSGKPAALAVCGYNRTKQSRDASPMDDGIAANRIREVGAITRDIMAQAPVNIFVFNPNGSILAIHTDEATVSGTRRYQSVGAAIENMILAAEGLGLEPSGSVMSLRIMTGSAPGSAIRNN